MGGNFTVYTFPIGNATDSPVLEVYDPYDGDMYVASTGEYADSPAPNLTVLNGTSGWHVPLTAGLAPYTPQALVCDNATGLVYLLMERGAGDHDEGVVLIVNGTNLVGEVSVGDRPVDELVDPWDGSVYVTNSVSSNVSVIHGTSLSATIPSVGPYPWGEAFDDRTGLVYVADNHGDNITVLNGSKTVGSITVGDSPYSVVYDPTNGFVYTEVEANSTGNGSAEEVVIDGSQVVGSVPVGGFFPLSYLDPDQPIYDPANHGSIDVLNDGSANVSIISGTNLSATVSVGSDPESGVFDAATGEVFVVDNHSSASVSVIEGSTIVATMPAGYEGAHAGVAAYDAADRCVYVGATGSPSVSAICGTAGNARQFPVDFREHGLPNGTTWGGTVDGTTIIGSSGSPLIFPLLNGTYPFLISPVAGYTVSPGSGSVTVNGSAVNVTVTFTNQSTAETFPVDFEESGLPNGTAWSVALNGTTRNSTNASISFSEPNGSYAFQVDCGSGYSANPSSGYANVTGVAVLVNVTCANSTVLLPLTFRESGLDAGSTWTVVITADSTGMIIELLPLVSRSAMAGSDLEFHVTEGGYTYLSSSVGFPSVSGAIRVGDEAPAVVTIQFAPATPGPNPSNTVLGLPPWAGFLGIAIAAIAALGLGATVHSFRTSERRRSRSVVVRMNEMEWRAGEDGNPEPRVGR